MGWVGQRRGRGGGGGGVKEERAAPQPRPEQDGKLFRVLRSGHNYRRLSLRTAGSDAVECSNFN